MRADQNSLHACQKSTDLKNSEISRYCHLFNGARYNHVPCIGDGTSEQQCAPPKPVISHEMGNFATFPDIPREIAAMNSSNLQVDGRQSMLNSLHARGFSPARLAEFVNKTNAHAYFCWKATVEFLRLAPYVTGHTWWLVGISRLLSR